MKTIANGRPDVQKILGKQDIKKTDYRLMKYVLQAEYNENLLLYNVITGRFILLTKEEFNDALFNDKAEIRNQLIENFFLVPFRYNEKATVDNLRLILKKLFPPEGINSYTILTTTNCNARCFYCYQNGFKHVNMGSETVDKLVDFIIHNKYNNHRKLQLHWFGGEPLLGIEQIDQICVKLHAKNIPFVSSIISNGYLFSEEIAKEAVSKWNLTRVQITLDGTENIYNRTKNYIAAQDNPYEHVLKNIKYLATIGVQVSIRMNLDQHNMDDLKNLADDLIKKIGRSKNIYAYVHVLFENEGFSPIFRDSTIAEALYDKQIELNKYLATIGLSKTSFHLPAIEINHCMADSQDSLVVFPDGTLYKCEHTKIGDEIGHISQTGFNTQNIKKFQETSMFAFCEDCQLYPKCILLKECNGKTISYRQKICQYEIDSVKRNLLKYLELQNV